MFFIKDMCYVVRVSLFANLANAVRLRPRYKLHYDIFTMEECSLSAILRVCNSWEYHISSSFLSGNAGSMKVGAISRRLFTKVGTIDVRGFFKGVKSTAIYLNLQF